MESVTFYPIDVQYKLIGEKAHIYLFGRTSEGKQICVIDPSFEPYFYVLPKENVRLDELSKQIEQIEVEINNKRIKPTRTELIQKNILREEKTLIRVYCPYPQTVPRIRKAVKEHPVIGNLIEDTFEYDIPFARRYLIDKRIIPLTALSIKAEPYNIRNKIPTFLAKEIDQTDKTIPQDSLRILAFDIETYNPAGRKPNATENPIIMLAFYGNNFKRVITWKKFKTENKSIEFVDGEAQLIERFIETIEQYKPDILVGFYSDGFDLPYIITRAKKYDINLTINLDYSVPTLARGKSESIMLFGIAHIDLFKFINKILGIHDLEFLSLQEIANQLLGEEKMQVDIDSLARIWDNKPELLEKFCLYNLKDAELTYKLLLKILPNITELVKLIALPLADINRMSTSQLVEWYIIRQIQDFNEIILNRPSFQEQQKRRLQTYKGAFVYEPLPGLYNNIAVFDFRSLYPSIIVAHNICLSTLNCHCCKNTAKRIPGTNDWFCTKHRGIIPQIVESLVTRRMRIKELLKQHPDSLLKARSQNLKLLANAFYGYLGFFAARWYNLKCAQSITALGRYYINKVISIAQNKGFKVIYADTDSIFLELKNKTRSDALAFAAEINQQLPSFMELEFEGFYPKGIFVATKEKDTAGAKKKYALLSENGEIVVKGFETVRRNWSQIAKELQMEVLKIILKESNPEKAKEYVRKIIALLKEGKIPNELLVIRIQLQKEVSDYASIAPHVAIAKKLQSAGYQIGPGSMIKYIIKRGKGLVRERAVLPEQLEQGGYDAEYYIQHQIIPAVERIFEVFGIKKENLLEQSQKQLGDFTD